MQYTQIGTSSIFIFVNGIEEIYITARRTLSLPSSNTRPRKIPEALKCLGYCCYSSLLSFGIPAVILRLVPVHILVRKPHSMADIVLPVTEMRAYGKAYVIGVG